MISWIFASTSFRFVRTFPSGSFSSTAATCFVFPAPLVFALSYSGLRLIVYVWFLQENTSSTSVGVSSPAYLERSMPLSRFSPLARPYSAYTMPSKIVVFPAPVSPVIRYSPSVPRESRSSTVVPAYGPKADIVSWIGLIFRPPSFSRSGPSCTVPALHSSSDYSGEHRNPRTVPAVFYARSPPPFRSPCSSGSAYCRS